MAGRADYRRKSVPLPFWGAGELCVGAGGGCSLFLGFRSFLRLRRALRKIRWVAQFGGVPGDALAAGGCPCARPRAGPSHCARVWSGGWRPRVVGTEGQGQGLRRRLRGERPRSGERGPRCWAPVVACGRLVPGSPSRRRLTEADRSGGIKSDRTLLGSGCVRLDTTGPVSLAAPADATGTPGQPRPVVWTWSTRVRTPAGGDVACPRGGNPSHRRGCPGSLVAVGGACTTIPDCNAA